MGEVAVICAVGSAIVLLMLGHLVEPPENPTRLVEWLLRRSRLTVATFVLVFSAVEGLLLERFWYSAVRPALQAGPIAIATLLAMMVLGVGVGLTLGRGLVEEDYSPLSTQ